MGRLVGNGAFIFNPYLVPIGTLFCHKSCTGKLNKREFKMMKTYSSTYDILNFTPSLQNGKMKSPSGDLGVQ